MIIIKTSEMGFKLVERKKWNEKCNQPKEKTRKEKKIYMKRVEQIESTKFQACH